MNPIKVGISNISIFIPDQEISLQEIVSQRIREDQKWERKLTRALEVTGQESLRFPSLWEDTATLAAQAVLPLVKSMNGKEILTLRYLLAGTETTVDLSKPVSNYVLGMLEKAGYALPSSLTSFQVQHACAGATLGILSAAGLLLTGQEHDKALVVASDISRYTAPSTAEVTQGAGAVAVLVERAPDLIELDLHTLGFYSRDVDDFFRPLDSKVAMVKGGYSVQCYNDSLIGAFQDHCDRAGVDPVEELRSVDVFALHVPYAQMPLSAMHRLLSAVLGLDEEEAGHFLAERSFQASLDATRRIGNIYSGSLYLGLAFCLTEQYRKWGEQLAGRKVLMASYGSGNTMAVVTGRICARAPQIIKSWDLQSILEGGNKADFAVYQNWLDAGQPCSACPGYREQQQIPLGRFYLHKIREDGYREYQFR